MEKKILIVVDVQTGFVKNLETKRVTRDIIKLLNDKNFDKVIATKFINLDNSPYEEYMNWDKLKDEPEINLIKEIESHADTIIPKSIYSCVNTVFIQMLKTLNSGQVPEEVFIVGMDTDCCVLKIATDLFEFGIRPIVLEKYCTSTGGIESHKAGIKCLERLIGKEQIV